LAIAHSCHLGTCLRIFGTILTKGTIGNEPARDSSPATAVSTETSAVKKGTASSSFHPLWQDVSDQSDLQDFNTVHFFHQSIGVFWHFVQALIQAKSVGTAFKFPQRFPDPLRIYGVPRSIAKDVRLANLYDHGHFTNTTQFNFLSKPFSVVRQATVDIVEQLENSKDPKNDSRLVISKKSVGLLV
jgi:hypothetical protein